MLGLRREKTIFKKFQSNFGRQGFSLTELLAALAILALLAAFIVPKFLNSQQAAEDTTATAIANNLNQTYADWLAAGGQVGKYPAAPQTSDLLNVLSSDGPVSQSSNPAAYDGGASSNVRTTLPSDTLQQLAAAGGRQLFSLTMSGTYTVAFVTDGNAPGSGTFYVTVLNSTNNFVAPHNLKNLTTAGLNKAFGLSGPSPYDLMNLGSVNGNDLTFIEGNMTVLKSLGAFPDD
jgi:prepilin-type N-terminal cleavage/methylation domain-containing protein